VTAAHLWVPPGRSGSYGDEVAALAEEIGRAPDADQRVALDAINSYGPGGRWWALEACVKEPRQNGKTGGIVLPTVLADLVLWPDPDRVAWTAHRMKTSRETFEDCKRLIEGSDLLRKRIRRPRETNGEEGFDFLNGSSLDFIARANGSGRGLGGRTVVIDEALFFTAGAAGDLLPILAARRNPRIIYASSACKAESEHLRALTARGRAGGDPSLILVEHCAPGGFESPGCEDPTCVHEYGVLGCILDDEAHWRAANPAMEAGRVGVMFLRAMRRSLPWREFAREFLGWDEPAGTGMDAFPAGAWESSRDPESAPGDSMAFGLEVTLDRSMSTFGAAGRREDGLAHVEVVDRRPGTAWVADRALELWERWSHPIVIDDRSPAAALVDDMDAAGVPVVRKSGAEVAALCAKVYDLARAGTLRHRGQADLDRAATAAVRVNVGDGGFRFSRRNSEDDITPLYAATLALAFLDDSGPMIW